MLNIDYKNDTMEIFHASNFILDRMSGLTKSKRIKSYKVQIGLSNSSRIKDVSILTVLGIAHNILGPKKFALFEVENINKNMVTTTE